MARDAVYEATREVRTYVVLAKGAEVLIEKSKQDEEGSFYTRMSSLLLTAFTFEAYLNHLGTKIITFWEEIEPIRVMDKYSVLYKQLKIKPNFGSRPYQTLELLFKFRNAIAHGKSEILEKTKMVRAQDDLHSHKPLTNWEKYCTLDNAKRAKEDISKIINELHKAAGLDGDPFILSSITESSIGE